MKLSRLGSLFIQSYEALRLTCYLCEAGVPTGGWGHTGKDVAAGQLITMAQAQAWWGADISVFEALVNKLVKVQPTQAEFDALVALSFNIGASAFASSTLLRMFNAGDRAGAGAQFPRWNLVKGAVSAGLTRRRAAEQAIFRVGRYINN
ncbi:MAG: lysozyme [Pseudomonadota bacterium]|nr:lysozyme [Pseudomonadota bacterium]